MRLRSLLKIKLSKVSSTKFGKLMTLIRVVLSIKKRPRISCKILSETLKKDRSYPMKLLMRCSPLSTKKTQEPLRSQRWSLLSIKSWDETEQSSWDNMNLEELSAFRLYHIVHFWVENIRTLKECRLICPSQLKHIHKNLVNAHQ